MPPLKQKAPKYPLAPNLQEQLITLTQQGLSFSE
jgi:hypothetical protein